MTVTVTELPVAGARLHCETRGDGPAVLLVPGGFADTGLYEPIAARLADAYTVASFDPRCYSRSRTDAPVGEQRVDEHADDIAAVVDWLAGRAGPVTVFASSSTAIAGLDLVARPEVAGLRLLVAHEPPSVGLLPDAKQRHAMFADVRQAFRDGGPAGGEAAMTRGFNVPASAPGTPDGPIDTPTESVAGLDPEALTRMAPNAPVFLEHMLVPFTDWLPDVAAVTRHADRLVLATGEESRGMLAAAPARRLAARAGVRTVEFPGGHVGPAQYPTAFADRLRELLP